MPPNKKLIILLTVKQLSYIIDMRQFTVKHGSLKL